MYSPMRLSFIAEGPSLKQSGKPFHTWAGISSSVSTVPPVIAMTYNTGKMQFFTMKKHHNPVKMSCMTCWTSVDNTLILHSAGSRYYTCSGSFPHDSGHQVLQERYLMDSKYRVKWVIKKQQNTQNGCAQSEFITKKGTTSRWGQNTNFLVQLSFGVLRFFA